MANNERTGCGCLSLFGSGSVAAAVLSAALNHSFWWSALHFALGWAYVLYALLARTKELGPALRAMFGL